MRDIETLVFSASKVARLLGMSSRGLHNWRKRGLGPRFVRVGRHILYPRGEVTAWLEKHTVEPHSKGSDRV